LRAGGGRPYDRVVQRKPLFESEVTQQAAVAVVMAAVLAGALGIAYATPMMRSALRARDAVPMRVGPMSFEVPGQWREIDAAGVAPLPGVDSARMVRLPALAEGPIALASESEPWVIKIDAGRRADRVAPAEVLNDLHRSGNFPAEGRRRFTAVHHGSPPYFVLQSMISQPLPPDGRRRVTVAAVVTLDGYEHALIIAQGIADPSRPLEQSRQLLTQVVYATVGSIKTLPTGPG